MQKEKNRNLRDRSGPPTAGTSAARSILMEGRARPFRGVQKHAGTPRVVWVAGEESFEFFRCLGLLGGGRIGAVAGVAHPWNDSME